MQHSVDKVCGKLDEQAKEKLAVLSGEYTCSLGYDRQDLLRTDTLLHSLLLRWDLPHPTAYFTCFESSLGRALFQYV